jgi:hypothetical protein
MEMTSSRTNCFGGRILVGFQIFLDGMKSNAKGFQMICTCEWDPTAALNPYLMAVAIFENRSNNSYFQTQVHRRSGEIGDWSLAKMLLFTVATVAVVLASPELNFTTAVSVIPPSSFLRQVH